MEVKTEATMWKSIKSWIRNRCQKWLLNWLRPPIEPPLRKLQNSGEMEVEMIISYVTIPYLYRIRQATLGVETTELWNVQAVHLCTKLRISYKDMIWFIWCWGGQHGTVRLEGRAGEIPRFFENSLLKPLNGQPVLGQCKENWFESK